MRQVETQRQAHRHKPLLVLLAMVHAALIAAKAVVCAITEATSVFVEHERAQDTHMQDMYKAGGWAADPPTGLGLTV